MPPRHTYWTIIVDGLPTAFRAAERDELQPTLERLRRKHPGAVMQWFARGRLWSSPEEARATRPPQEARPPSWRPGGRHEDPRERFKKPPRQRRPWDARGRPEAPADEHGARSAAGRPP